MPIVTLRDLYVADLSALVNAEQQILLELPAMAARATSGDLRQLLDLHREQTLVHVERLALLFRRLDEAPGELPCEAIRGLIQDSRRRDAETERGEVLDAALIATAQRIAHYEIAAYGCVRAYARTLGDDEAAHLLQQTLDEEGAVDHRLTQVAEHGINQGAGADILEKATTYRSQLRYVAAVDLPEFSDKTYRVSNGDADDLGALDGLIVDGRSGSAVYFVVDAGGWFAGPRYVVPVGAVRPDDTAHLLRTELTREALRRYPEFNASAFLARDGTDALNYDRLFDDVASRGETRPEITKVGTDTPETQTAQDAPAGAPQSGSEPETPAPRIERYHER